MIKMNEQTEQRRNTAVQETDEKISPLLKTNRCTYQNSKATFLKNLSIEKV